MSTPFLLPPKRLHWVGATYKPNELRESGKLTSDGRFRFEKDTEIFE